MEQKYYTVSQLTYYLKELLREDSFLCGLWLRGELSSAKRHSSGHIYLTLTDGSSALRAVMFRNQACRLSFMPEVGMDVLVFGTVSVYERDGNCQIYVEEMIPAGSGAAALAFEQLKKKLEAEGLFAQEKKRALPAFPLKIAVVTSAEGAAWADIKRIAANRNPAVVLQLFPCLVQGVTAPQSICSALRKAASAADCDLLIVGRGGGSGEDLSAFNDEQVARQAANFPLPVISAVGHESDYSLLDLVADVRAATPTHAAQLAVPDRQELLEQLKAKQRALFAAAAFRLQKLNSELEGLAARAGFLAPRRFLDDKMQYTDSIETELQRLMKKSLDDAANQLQQAGLRLNALSPAAVFNRGYALARDTQGNIIRSAGQVQIGDKISLLLADGKLHCALEGKEITDGEEKIII